MKDKTEHRIEKQDKEIASLKNNIRTLEQMIKKLDAVIRRGAEQNRRNTNDIQTVSRALDKAVRQT